MAGDLTVLYDRDCGICTHVARVLARLDGLGRLHLISAQVAEIPNMPPRIKLLRDLHVVDARGRWSVGGAAMVEISRRVPLLWPISAAAKLPLAMPILDVYYRSFADNRHRISRLFGLKACRVPRREG